MSRETDRLKTELKVASTMFDDALKCIQRYQGVDGLGILALEEVKSFLLVGLDRSRGSLARKPLEELDTPKHVERGSVALCDRCDAEAGTFYCTAQRGGLECGNPLCYGHRNDQCRRCGGE